MPALILLLALAASLPARADDPAPAPPAPPAVVERTERDLVDDKLLNRVSLPTEEDRTAWGQPGFGLQLGYARGRFWGVGPSSGFAVNDVLLRARVRLDADWSVALGFQYAGATGAFDGLRWSATAESIFHATDWAALSLGVGYGGLYGQQYRHNAPWQPPGWGQGEAATRELGANEEIAGCEGGGLVAVARVEAQVVLGPLFATGPFAQLEGQTTHCAAKFQTGSDEDTGREILALQWWTQGGASLGWWLSWR